MSDEIPARLDALDRAADVLAKQLRFADMEQFCLAARAAWTAVWAATPWDATPNTLPHELRAQLDRFIAVLERGVRASRLVFPDQVQQGSLLAEYDRNVRFRWDFALLLRNAGAAAVADAMREFGDRLEEAVTGHAPERLPPAPARVTSRPSVPAP